MDYRDFHLYHFVVSIILVILVIVTNGLTLVCVCKFECLRRQRYALITSLSVDNILCSAPVLATIAYFGIYGTSCAPTSVIFTLYSLNSFPYFVTFVHMILISLDQFISITFPLRYHSLVTKTVMTAMICCCWLLPFLYTCASFTWLIGQPVLYCFTYKIATSIFVTAPIVILCVVFATVLTLYGRIMMIAAQQANKRHTLNLNSNANDNNGSKKLPKGMKMIVTLLGLFVIMYVPLLFYDILIYSEDKNPAKLTMSGSLSQECILAMSFVNNIIYAAFSKDFRCAYKKLLCRDGNKVDITNMSTVPENIDKSGTT